MDYIIKNEKFMVRRIVEEDAPQFTKWWNDGNLMESVGFKNGLNTTVEKVTEKFKKELESSNPPVLSFIILDAKNDLPIGELSYGEIDLENKSCRIAIKICDLSYQGKGYGHDALCSFFDYLYNKCHFDLILIDTILTNERAIHLYRKIGSKEIEIKRNFWTTSEGVSLDAIFFELKKEDFYDYLKSIKKKDGKIK